ncbi:MAG: toll/interleukin-1 receptor domain-containing protein [Roseivirga sp.]|nr:toll/interleukin-1 receptor domain-containing protein [Roseivirga sp.]
MKADIPTHVAISFTEQDDEIAQVISKRLNDYGVTTYYYKDKTSENWGRELEDLTIEKYSQAELVLLILSEAFFKKKWTRKELEIALKEHEKGKRYILPLTVGEIDLDLIPKGMVTQNWTNNSKFICKLIIRRLISGKDSKGEAKGYDDKSTNKAKEKEGKVDQMIKNNGKVGEQINITHLGTFNQKES